MNVNMWEHAATQENLATLRTRGVHVVEPDEGYLACGMIGSGRLAATETIALKSSEILGFRKRSRRQDGADHRRAYHRGPRSGAIPLEPLVRQNGVRPGGGCHAPRRAHSARQRPHRFASA